MATTVSTQITTTKNPLGSMILFLGPGGMSGSRMRDEGRRHANLALCVRGPSDFVAAGPHAYLSPSSPGAYYREILH